MTQKLVGGYYCKIRRGLEFCLSIDMQLLRKVVSVLLIWAFVIAPCSAQQAAPDEKGLWDIWQCQTNKPDDHVAAIEACKEFRTKSPKDPLVTVAIGLEAWHLLKDGKTNEAIKIFEPMIPLVGDSIQKAGSDMACGWLSRIDREKLVDALTKVYLKEIEFPLSLTSIKPIPGKPPLQVLDRWNQAWIYQAEKRANIPRQGYSLQSKHLGGLSDLNAALAIPYADRVSLIPVRIMPGSTDKVTIEFMLPTQKTVYLQAGTVSDGIVVAYVGARIVVISDGTHWKVAAKPR